jgi:hypothetical protein
MVIPQEIEAVAEPAIGSTVLPLPVSVPVGRPVSRRAMIRYGLSASAALGLIGIGWMSKVSRTTGAVATSAALIPLEEDARVGDWSRFVARTLQRDALPPGEQGFRLMLGVEPPAHPRTGEPFPAMQSRFGPLGGAAEPLAHCDRETPYVGVVRRTARPGMYRLEIGDGSGQGRTLGLAVPVFTGRLTELVLHRDLEGVLHLNYYAPQTGDPRGRSPEVLEPLAGAQRDVESSAGASARDRIEQLANPVIDDPIGAVLSAYFLTLDGRPEDLAPAAADLVKRFPDLPDGYVLEGLAAEVAENPRAAVGSYRRALDRGLPVLLPFLEYLWEGARTRRADPSLVLDLGSTRYGNLLRTAQKSRVPYQLWTAWELGR